MEAMESMESLPPITLCFFVQEEIGLHGSRNLTVSKLGRPELALNFDGGDPFKMTVGATGGERMLYGTDWPFYHLAATLAKVLIVTRERPVLRDAILRRNAERLFGLPTSNA